jgi:butyryl-CoA dehydrogenase
MAQYMSMDHLRFCLYDVHKIEDVLAIGKFSDYDKESIDMLLDAVKVWADKEAFPYFREMDEKPVVYEDGIIKVHPQIGKAMKDAGDNGWIGATFDYDQGGLQLPHMVMSGMYHIIESANNNINGYMGLTAGAADLIRTFGSKQIFDAYVPKMMAGDWGGTMCLTEPQAGSSLSDITTSAHPQADGTYKIKGQKIFISGGDHEYCSNFIHLTLVRIDGAPIGTKGISLMVVPKFRIAEAGNLVPNDVVTVADFQKLGQRGYATTHLAFGEHDDCIGYLLGEENKGLKYMFQMMNGARIDVGLTAASTASAAYYASLQYAMERPQGRKILNHGKKDPLADPVLIIEHPDVRRMLFLQKAIVEGSISLLIECTKYADLAENAGGTEGADAHDMLEFLTPIAKTYPSEKGIESISNGLQILGGYGFCMDFPLQQYYRDIRIMTLYEGTTGIQSLDLLGRKATMKNGQVFNNLLDKINEVMEEASKFGELVPYTKMMKNKIKEIQGSLAFLIPLAMKKEFEKFLADATIFMEMTSILVIGYQWLKMAVTAKESLVTGKGQFSNTFYKSKIHTMKFYFKYEMPKISACAETILNPETLTIKEETKELFV